MGTMQMTGARVFSELDSLRLDYAFNGTLGYSLEYGFGYQSLHAFMMTEQLRKRANKMVIVMDSAKVESVRAMYNFAPENVDILISDDNLGKDAARALSKDHVMIL